MGPSAIERLAALFPYDTGPGLRATPTSPGDPLLERRGHGYSSKTQAGSDGFVDTSKYVAEIVVSRL